jgi:hypothetical protein
MTSSYRGAALAWRMQADAAIQTPSRTPAALAIDAPLDCGYAITLLLSKSATRATSTTHEDTLDLRIAIHCG